MVVIHHALRRYFVPSAMMVPKVGVGGWMPMPMKPKIASKINMRATAMELKAQALKDGMVPMRHYGFRKVSEGITTLEEVMTVTAASE